MEGFSLVVDKELAKQTGTIRIDMTYYGFTVDSENPVGGGGGGCSGSCSTGGSSCSC